MFTTPLGIMVWLAILAVLVWQVGKWASGDK